MLSNIFSRARYVGGVRYLEQSPKKNDFFGEAFLMRILSPL